MVFLLSRSPWISWILSRLLVLDLLLPSSLCVPVCPWICLRSVFWLYIWLCWCSSHLLSTLSVLEMRFSLLRISLLCRTCVAFFTLRPSVCWAVALLLLPRSLLLPVVWVLPLCFWLSLVGCSLVLLSFRSSPRILPRTLCLPFLLLLRIVSPGCSSRRTSWGVLLRIWFRLLWIWFILFPVPGICWWWVRSVSLFLSCWLFCRRFPLPSSPGTRILLRVLLACLVLCLVIALFFLILFLHRLSWCFIWPLRRFYHLCPWILSGLWSRWPFPLF